MAGQRQQFVARLVVPDFHHLINAAGGQPRAVAIDGHSADNSAVIADRANALAGFHIPGDDRASEAAGDQRAAVGIKRERIGARFPLARQVADLDSLLHIPQLHAIGAEYRREQVAIGAEAEGFGVAINCLQRAGDELAVGHVVDSQRRLAVGRGDQLAVLTKSHSSHDSLLSGQDGPQRARFWVHEQRQAVGAAAERRAVGAEGRAGELAAGLHRVDVALRTAQPAAGGGVPISAPG